jgi:RHS repeat-associated protein
MNDGSGAKNIDEAAPPSFICCVAHRDSLDRLNALSVAGQALAYGYDAASRLQTVTTGAHTANYAYLPDSTLVSTLTFKNGGVTRLTTTMAYDKLNRLSAVSHAPAGPAQSHAYDYNAANQRTKVTREDNAYWDFGYDTPGQLTSGKKKLVSQALLLGHDYAYTYDDIGNRKTATINGQTSTYTPNTLNQYPQRTVPGTVDVFGRAAAEATVTVTSPATGGTISPTQRQGEAFYQQLSAANTTTAQFPSLKITAVKNNAGPAAEDVVSEVTKTAFVAKTPEAFSYDADGNLTADGRWTYTWDAENRLIACETNALAAAAGAPRQKLEFAYDAYGRRVQKKVSTWNGTAYAPTSELSSVYDGWNLIAEIGANGSLVRSYTWGLDLSGSLQGAGGVGGLLSVSSGSATYFTSYDGNGNIAGLVNTTTGTLDAAFEYSPFGEVIKAVGPAANTTPFGFSTKYTDQETSLAYYGFRYYNPATGRWLNRDPIEEKGGVNPYGMVRNNPLNLIDRLGLDPVVVSPPVVAPGPMPGIPGTLDGPPLSVPRVPVFIPAPGPIGGYANDNTQPNWTNPDVATLARSSGVGAQTACRKLALAAFGQNQYFYAATSHNRATGAAAVLWKKQNGQLPQIDPPGWNAAAHYRRGSVDRGHLIPFSYGGAGDYRNVVTQERGFNRGRFRTEIIGKLDAATDGGKGGGCNYACLVVVPVYRGQGATGVRDLGKPVPHAFTVLIVTPEGVQTQMSMMQPTLVGNLANDVYAPWNTWDTGNIELN